MAQSHFLAVCESKSDLQIVCSASFHFQYDPMQIAKASELSAIDMLIFAKLLKIGIYRASTSEVYCYLEIHPQPKIYWVRVNPTDHVRVMKRHALR